MKTEILPPGKMENCIKEKCSYSAFGSAGNTFYGITK